MSTGTCVSSHAGARCALFRGLTLRDGSRRILRSFGPRTVYLVSDSTNNAALRRSVRLGLYVWDGITAIVGKSR